MRSEVRINMRKRRQKICFFRVRIGKRMRRGVGREDRPPMMPRDLADPAASMELRVEGHLSEQMTCVTGRMVMSAAARSVSCHHLQYRI